MKIFAMTLITGTAAGLHVTPENFAEKSGGKSVFLKFYAPWCGHCKSMKPAWDSLMSEFEDSPTALVAEVDCTAGGKDLCQQHGVQGYPTIKYGDPDDLQDYQGGRDLDSLKKFASENLGPVCGIANMDLCDAEKKEKLEGFMAMSSEDLKTKIEEEEKKITDAEENFKTELEKLQKQYEELSKNKDETIAKVKDSGLGMMKSVLKHQQKEDKEEL